MADLPTTVRSLASRVRTRWAGAWPYALAALPVALLTLYAKIRWMEMNGYIVAARSLGRPHLADFDSWERLSFLRWDVIWVGLLYPAFTVFLAGLAPRRARAAVVGAVCMLTVVLLYVQVKALDSVGAYQHLRMLYSAFKFGLQNPGMMSSYVEVSGLVKLGAVLLAIAGAAWWAGRVPRWFERFAGPAYAIALLAGIVVTRLTHVPATRFHRSLLADGVRAYLWEGSTRPQVLADIAVADLAPRYREIAGIPASPSGGVFTGRAKGYDVVLFILETVPRSCVDFTGDLSDLPNFATLRRQAFVGERHYTTYPYTSYAVLSLLTSWYPASYAANPVDLYPNGHMPSLIRSLGAAGYRGAVYSPYKARFEPDPRMYVLLGFHQQVYADPMAAGRGNDPWRQIAGFDSATFHQLTMDAGGWIGDGQRYAAVFLPQIGHAPWPDPDGQSPDLSMRCRKLVRMQDRWLGDLLAVLHARGRLHRTLIVVTADHGIRTREEDPAFAGGVVDEYSFRVPFLLYAPGVVSQSTPVTTITSHIDVAPSLRDLLGLEVGAFEQGNTLWDPRLPERTTFFFAERYLGADAYHRGDVFASWNHVSDIVYRTQASLHFGSAQIVPNQSPAYDESTALIERMSALQRSWVGTLMTKLPTP